MDRAPSLQLIMETSWRLFLDRGWQVFGVIFLASLPLSAYKVSLHLDLIPNLFSSITAFAGERPRISEEGWFSLVWYVQKVSVINASVSVVVFGWIHAIAITLCAFIATNWQSEESMAKTSLSRRLFPTCLVVWGVLIITRICGQIANTAFVLPSLFLGALWYVAVFVAADERIGPVQSLKKSSALTRQLWWGVFALVCMFWFFGVGMGFVRARALLPYFLESGYEVRHWMLLDLAFRDIIGVTQSFASIIVSSATYLVLKRSALGPSSREMERAFE